jgi:integrase
MPRATKSAKLDSRTARSKLPLAGKPVYVQIGRGLFLGYRKNNAGGRWVARCANGVGKYRVEVIADADDKLSANGTTVLDFFQAQRVAQAQFLDLGAKLSGARDPANYTVRDCLDDYFLAKGSTWRSAADARSRADALIIPKLGHRPVMRLTSNEMRTWAQDLAAQPRRLRSRKGQPTRFAEVDMNEREIVRKRQASANRTLTIFKAALNYAFREGYVPDDRSWRRVRPFRDADAARIRYLSDDEIQKLLISVDGAFELLIRAALHTGARYGELTCIWVKDFDVRAQTVFVGKSKSGKARSVHLTDEGAEFFRAICSGRDGDEVLFLRDDGQSWGKSHQVRRMVEAAEKAGLSEAVSFHELRHTYASHAVMNGMPLMVLAGNLGHSDTRMVEKHYGHMSDEFRRLAVQKTGLKFESAIENG